MIFAISVIGFIIVMGVVGAAIATAYDAMLERDNHYERIRRENLKAHSEDEWWDIEENWK